MLRFWSRLMTTEKLSSKIYKLLLKLYANENSQTLYVKNIQTILDNIGLSFRPVSIGILMLQSLNLVI
jgi:hypothetical protein